MYASSEAQSLPNPLFVPGGGGVNSHLAVRYPMRCLARPRHCVSLPIKMGFDRIFKPADASVLEYWVVQSHLHHCPISSLHSALVLTTAKIWHGRETSALCS